MFKYEEGNVFYMRLQKEVYFTIYGKRYHIKSCPYIEKCNPYYVINTSFESRLKEQKLRPCKLCKPVLR